MPFCSITFRTPHKTNGRLSRGLPRKEFLNIPGQPWRIRLASILPVQQIQVSYAQQVPRLRAEMLSSDNRCILVGKPDLVKSDLILINKSLSCEFDSK